MYECKEAIATAVIVSQILPEIFSFENMLSEICFSFGTEYTVTCLLEMGIQL